MVAGNERDVGGLHDGFGHAFRSHRLDCPRRRADEDNAVLNASPCKVCIFRKKTVAGVKRFSAGAFCCLYQLLRNQVTVSRGRWPYCKGFIGKTDMPRVDIRLGIYRDRPDTHAFRRMDNAAGDFTAVGDEYLIKHYRGVRGRDTLGPR